MKKINILIYLLAILLVLTNLIQGQTSPSNLDSTFGTDGLVNTNIDYGSGGFSFFNDVAVQSDGKIVAAGTFSGRGNADVALTRFNTDGSRDNTFGTDGIVITPVLDSSELIRSIKIQSDGKIVVAGRAFFEGDSSRAFVLVLRYNQDSSPDPTFNDNGRVLADLGSNVDIFKVEVQTDGKIVVAGTLNSSRNFIVARFNSNGTPDIFFGNNGLVTFSVGANQLNILSGMTIQANGKIIVVGFSRPSRFTAPVVALVARLNSNGSFDTTFSGSGQKVVRVGTNPSTFATEAVVDAQNRITVVGGTFADGSSLADFLVFRLMTNGDFDNSFDSDGMMTFDVGLENGNLTNDSAADIGITNNKIFITGISNSASVVSKLDLDGSLDTTFGEDGTLLVPFPGGGEKFDFDPQNNLVLVGSRDITDNGILTKINTNGDPVTDFDFDGTLEAGFGESVDEAYKVQHLYDGKILVSGVTHLLNQRCHIAVRYNSDGSVDNSFNQTINQFMCNRVGRGSDSNGTETYYLCLNS